MKDKPQNNPEAVGVAAAEPVPAETAMQGFRRANSAERRAMSYISKYESPAGLAPLPRPQWLPERVWPFQTQALEFEGARIAVTDVGKGPVLLFVHTGMWSFVWRDVMLRLAQDFRCVCFDAPGCGQSDRLPSRAITLEKASRALTAVIHALDLNDITLIVHDLGGPSGIVGALRVPERIRAICAVNAFAWKPSGLLFRGMLGFIGNPAVREVSAWTGILTRITSSAFGVGKNMDVASRKAFLDGVGRRGLRAFHSYLRDARRARAIYDELSLALVGPFSRLPLLTIFGERNDPLGFQPRWKQLFPTARQIVVSKGNHFPMCDDPDLVATSICELHRDHVAPALGHDLPSHPHFVPPKRMEK